MEHDGQKQLHAAEELAREAFALDNKSDAAKALADVLEQITGNEGYAPDGEPIPVDESKYVEAFMNVKGAADTVNKVADLLEEVIVELPQDEANTKNYRRIIAGSRIRVNAMLTPEKKSHSWTSK